MAASIADKQRDAIGPAIGNWRSRNARTCSGVSIMQTMTPDRGGVVTNGFSSKIATKLRKSAYVLRKEGAPRLLELSALSLIEPIRVLRLRAAVSFDAT